MAESSKRAIIYVFSGTGNTFITAEKTARALFEKGIQTDLYRVCSQDSQMYQSAFYRCEEDGKLTAACPESFDLNTEGCLLSSEFGIVPNPNHYDLAGFAYPIHAFNTPQIFLRFVKQLPSLNDDKKGSLGFIFKTSGEPFKPNASSSRTLAYFLKKKGYLPCMDLHILMPYNIMFRYPDAMAKQMYLHMEQLSCRLAEDVANAVFNYVPIQTLRFNPLITFMSYIFRIQWPAAKVNGKLHAVKSNLCVGCGACVKNCPTSNIELQPLVISANETRMIPKIGFHCTMCMECTMVCPKAAINPGFLTPWKVNPKWDFDRILNDVTIPSNWTDDANAGYFKLFRKYFAEPEVIDSTFQQEIQPEDIIIPNPMDFSEDEDEAIDAPSYKELPLH